jgi:septum site-determining protein MinD
MGNVFLINSEKIDIGKTIIGIKIGIELSSRGKKVLLIDLSKGNKKIAEYFKVDEDIIYDIKDVLDDMCSMQQAIIDISENLSILPFPRIANKLDCINRENFSKLTNEAKAVYDTIIVDVDGISSCYYIDFTNVEGMIVINDNDFSAVREINNGSEIVKKFGLKENIFIINKYNKKNASKGTMFKIKDLNKLLDVDILAIIEAEIKYSNADYNFLFNKEPNSFNNVIDSISNKVGSFS